jgi:hypothetical protein
MVIRSQRNYDAGNVTQDSPTILLTPSWKIQLSVERFVRDESQYDGIISAARDGTAT